MSFNLGIDVGGTKVLLGVVGKDGEVKKELRCDTPREGGSALIGVIADAAKKLITEFEVSGIGVCAPGFISSDRRTVIACPNVAGWNDLDLAKSLEELLNQKIVVENDANAAAWGEKKFGAGVKYHSLVMLTIGTGLGGGFIDNNALFRVAALDPQAIVIGGGVVEAGEILLAPIRDSLRRHLPFSGKYPIPNVVAATLGNKAGLVGAADLASY